MWGVVEVLNSEVEPLVGSGQLDDIVASIELHDAIHDLLESGIVPVNQQGAAVHGPFKHGPDGDNVDILRSREVSSLDGLGNVRHNVGCLVRAEGGVVIAGSLRRRRSVYVGHDATDIVLARIVRALGLRNSTHPEVVSDVGLVGRDNDIISLALGVSVSSHFTGTAEQLTNADIQVVRLVGNNGVQISRDDL